MWGNSDRRLSNIGLCKLRKLRYSCLREPPTNPQPIPPQRRQQTFDSSDEFASAPPRSRILVIAFEWLGRDSVLRISLCEERARLNVCILKQGIELVVDPEQISLEYPYCIVDTGTEVMNYESLPTKTLLELIDCPDDHAKNFLEII